MPGDESRLRVANPPPQSTLYHFDGVVAQLVEHHNGIVGVRGSNPLGSSVLRHGADGQQL